jgi:hypothetical protein
MRTAPDADYFRRVCQIQVYDYLAFGSWMDAAYSGQGTTTFSEAKNVTLFGQATSDLKPIFFS